MGRASATAGLLLACLGARAAATDTGPPTAFDAREPQPVLDWGQGRARSFAVPAWEIPTFQFLLNRFDHVFEEADTYPGPFANLHRNLHRDWVVDNDKFSTNQFLHPYQGSVYQGLARSAGLGFWEASAYTFAGSALWEMAGENTAPSINDQIATGIGGNFLGEPLFRIASLLLESSGGGRPAWWRELGAAVISPPTGLNRWLYGSRFAAVFRSNEPAVFTRVDVGGNLRSRFSSNVRVNSDPSAPPAGQTYQPGRGTAAFTVGYGLPGKTGYDYDRPFDYFSFELALDTANGVESVFSRGLLHGVAYGQGSRYRGIWGIYGIYDYVAPNIFRVSNTAAGLGTTGQWWLSRRLALQSTAIAALGYAGGGVIHGTGVRSSGTLGEGQRNYHYGVTPESILALRLILGDRAAIDISGRGYYISKLGATETTGSESIDRLDAALTVRIFDLHGITLRYTVSNRAGRYVGLPDSSQRVATVGLGYTLLGHERFGAVDWRPSLQK